MKKPIPIVNVLEIDLGLPRTYRLDGELQVAFIEDLADRLQVVDKDRQWMHEAISFKALYEDMQPAPEDAIEDIRKFLDGFDDWHNRLPSGLVGRLRVLLGDY